MIENDAATAATEQRDILFLTKGDRSAVELGVSGAIRAEDTALTEYLELWVRRANLAYADCKRGEMHLPNTPLTVTARISEMAKGRDGYTHMHIRMSVSCSCSETVGAHVVA
jgi:hypothetical protein